MYDLDKIRFSVGGRTYERAVGLYENGKVTDVRNEPFGFAAVVHGTHPYRVFVSNRHIDEANCDCYLGERDELCKHVVALAIHAALDGQPLPDEYRTADFTVSASDEQRELTSEEIRAAKAAITAGLRYIRPYNGPSKIWFQYQDSLCEGCNRLSVVISGLPVGVASAKILVDLLLRLERKIRNGVDDSDGTVGGLMFEIVAVLEEYAKRQPECIDTFEKLCKLETCFGWEENLVAIVDGRQTDG